MKLHHYDHYDDYIRAQIEANRRKQNSLWAQKENIDYLARVVQQFGPTMPEFGICHGTRNGAEQRWFAQALGCPVIGTEISPSASQYDDTIEWDFHRPNTDWFGVADFVYSNALDHAFNPMVALETWRDQLMPGGLLLIEHSDDCDGEDAVTKFDPFGATRQEVAAAVAEYVSDVFIIELPKRKPRCKELHCVVGVR